MLYSQSNAVLFVDDLFNLLFLHKTNGLTVLDDTVVLVILQGHDMKTMLDYCSARWHGFGDTRD